MIIPLEKNLYQSPTSYFLNLIYDLMENIHGCETCNTEDINIDLLQKHDTVFITEGAGFAHIDLYKKLNMKVIVIYDDIHYWDRSGKEFRHNMFSKADVILLPYHKQFLKMKEYEPYHHKSVWFPYYASKYALETNIKWEDKKDKALLTGARTKYYMFRQSIVENEHIEILEHPGYYGKFQHNLIRDSFFDYVSKFKGGIITSANKNHTYNGPDYVFDLEYTLMKYFEIPACEVVPFMQPTVDTEELGFIDGTNCVFINEKNYKQKIADNILNREIAINARKFIKNNHSFSNRLASLQYIIQDIGK